MNNLPNRRFWNLVVEFAAPSGRLRLYGDYRTVLWGVNAMATARHVSKMAWWEPVPFSRLLRPDDLQEWLQLYKRLPP